MREYSFDIDKKKHKKYLRNGVRKVMTRGRSQRRIRERMSTNKKGDNLLDNFRYELTALFFLTKCVSVFVICFLSRRQTVK